MREYKKEDKKAYIKIEKLKKMERLKAEIKSPLAQEKKSSTKSTDHSLKMQRFMLCLPFLMAATVCVCIWMYD